MTPTRPVLRYHGGKWRLGPWVIAHLPSHRIYVEPFGGAASVLIQKGRSEVEIYNDLDREIVSLFRVLRDRKKAARLRRLVELTPYARDEFEESYEPVDDLVEQARRTLIRSWMAHGSSGLRGHKTGFRLGSKRERTTSAGDWRSFPTAIPAIVERLAGVFIERRPAAKVIAAHDGPSTLFYVDPPYPFGTRSQKRIGNDLYHGYRHELEDDGHRALLRQLKSVAGLVVLSTYPNPIYEAELAGWGHVLTDAHADRGEGRQEVLYLNPSTCRQLERDSLPLLAIAEAA